MMLNQTVVLHGESGTGKSSLVQAGLLPILEQYNAEMKMAGKPVCIPVTIRFDAVEPLQHDENKTTTDPAVLVKQTLKIINEQNPYKDDDLPYLNKREDSFWYTAKQFEKNNCTLLLVFDQFEALQGYDYAQVTNFVNELSGIFSGVMPSSIYSEYDQQTESLTNEKSFSETERKAYSDDIRFLEKPLSAKALFIVREDKLGTMSLLSGHFPDILKNDFLLYRLDKKNAAKAIREPAALEGDFESASFSYEDDAVDDLLQNLADQSTGLYDPIQLQIVCSSIEQNIANKKNIIKKEDIPSVGDIIRDFYNEIWAGIKNSFKLPDAAFEIKRKAIIKELVVKDSRNLVLENLLINPFSKEDREIIRTLTDKGLLRRIPSGNDTYYQLSHDRLRAPLTQDLKELQAKEDMQEQMKVQRARAKNKRILFLGITAALLAIAFTVAIVIYIRANREEKIAEQQKYLLISTALKRDADPTMSYVISRDLLEKKKGFEMIRDFLKPFDTAKFVYLNGIYPAPSTVVSAGILSDSELVITEKENRSVWNIRSGFMTERKALKDNPLKRLYTENGWRDLYQSGDLLTVKDKTGKTLATFTAFAEDPANISISPDDQYLMVDETLYNISIPGGKKTGTIKKSIETKSADHSEKKEYWETASVFLSNNRVAAAYENGDIIIYDITSSKIDSVYRIVTGQNNIGGNNNISSLAVDNGRQLLFAENAHNGIDVFENITGKGNIKDSVIQEPFHKKTELKGHTGPVNSLAVSADNKLLLSGSSDRSAIIWNLGTMQKITVLKGPESSEISFVSFLKNGHLITATDENVVYLWQMEKPGKLYDQKLLYRYSPFNYKIWELDEKKDGKPRNTTATKDLYSSTLNYLVNMPHQNDYPEDEVYNKSLKESISEIETQYKSLVARKDYQTEVPDISKNILNRYYFDLMLIKSKLLNTNQSEIDLDLIIAKRDFTDFNLYYHDSINLNSPVKGIIRQFGQVIFKYLDTKLDYSDGYRMITYYRDSVLSPLIAKFGEDQNTLRLKAAVKIGFVKYFLYTHQPDKAETTANELSEISLKYLDYRIYKVAVLLATNKYDEAIALYRLCNSENLGIKLNNVIFLSNFLKRLVERNLVKDEYIKKLMIDFPGLYSSAVRMLPVFTQ